MSCACVMASCPWKPLALHIDPCLGIAGGKTLAHQRHAAAGLALHIAQDGGELADIAVAMPAEGAEQGIHAGDLLVRERSAMGADDRADSREEGPVVAFHGGSPGQQENVNKKSP